MDASPEHQDIVTPPADAERPRRREDPRILAARSLMEGSTLSLAAISGKTGVAQSTLQGWRKRFGWERPLGAPPFPAEFAKAREKPRRGATEPSDRKRRQMINRLFRAFGRQVADVETRTYDPDVRTDEKDARMLGTLARTLATLMALERDGGAPATDRETADRGELEAELVQRIKRWAGSGEGSG